MAWKRDAASIAFAAAALALAGAVGTSALAEDSKPRFKGAENPPQTKAIPCSCRYKGEKIPIGSSICMKTANGLRRARCSLYLNNTSWEFLEGDCPTA